MWENIFGEFNRRVVDFGPRIPGIIFSLLFGYLIIKLILELLEKSLKIGKISKALSNIILSISTAILWVVLFSELAQEAGMASLAVKISGSLILIGLAVVNGISSLAADIVSGVFLSKDKDFEVGYKIKTGEIEGVIQKIDIRKTRILADGRLQIIPNSKIDSTGWSVLDRGR